MPMLLPVRMFTARSMGCLLQRSKNNIWPRHKKDQLFLIDIPLKKWDTIIVRGTHMKIELTSGINDKIQIKEYSHWSLFYGKNWWSVDFGTPEQLAEMKDPQLRMEQTMASRPRISRMLACASGDINPTRWLWFFRKWVLGARRRTLITVGPEHDDTHTPADWRAFIRDL